MTVCRYDLRKSANNAEERRLQRLQGTSSAEKALTPDQLQVAKASIGVQQVLDTCIYAAAPESARDSWHRGHVTLPTPSHFLHPKPYASKALINVHSGLMCAALQS